MFMLKYHLLWQYQNLHNENAEEYETGTSHVVLKRRQSGCSVLEKERANITNTIFKTDKTSPN